MRGPESLKDGDEFEGNEKANRGWVKIHQGVIGGTNPFVVMKAGEGIPPIGYDVSCMDARQPFMCCYNPSCEAANAKKEGALVDLAMSRNWIFLGGEPWVGQVVHCHECDCLTLICKD